MRDYPVVQQVLGGLLFVLVLVDVWLTVLYARIGTSIISYRVAVATWHAFRWGARPFGRHRSTVLTFCGPFVLVLLVFFWSMALAGGAALMLQPALGSAVRAGTGATPTDFVTALFVGGSSLSVLSASGFEPHTSAYKLFFLLNSIVGTAVTSLTLMYLMQVYNALQRRNTLGLKLHLLAAENGDAAELLAGLGPQGQFSSGYTVLAEMAAEMTHVKESFHFYPVLFYFRFRKPHYSVSRITLMCFDTVSLLKTTLSDEQHGWLKESAPVAQLWRAAMLLVMTLTETYLPRHTPDPNYAPDAATAARWRARYRAARQRLQEAGIDTLHDEQTGADAYVRLRTLWFPYIEALAPTMAFRPDEIDPVGQDPASAGLRPAFASRLRTGG